MSFVSLEALKHMILLIAPLQFKLLLVLFLFVLDLFKGLMDIINLKISVRLRIQPNSCSFLKLSLYLQIYIESLIFKWKI